jgi:hypothetical protein
MVAGEGHGYVKGLGKLGGRMALQGRKTSSSPASACPGEEEAQCRSKQHYFVLFYFYYFLTVHETTPFCLKHVVSFKMKRPQNMLMSKSVHNL